MSDHQATLPRAEIREHHGAPAIFVNDTPIPGVGFWRAPHHDERYLKDLARVGARVVWFTVDMSSWVAPDAYDFTALDAAWERMLAAHPLGWYIPRIMLRPPEWWTIANPSELRLCEDASPYQGTPDEYLHGQVLPSPSSRKWRSDTMAFLRAFVAHHEASPYAARIIGYHLSNEQSEEWFYWGGPHIDYHPSSEADFRRYLRGIYADDEALRAAWNQRDVSLESARIPSQHDRRTPAEGDFFSPTTQRHVVDYYRFHHERIVDIIGEFAALVKSLTTRRALVGVFYGYQLQPIPRGQLDSGHYALGKLLASPDIDYLSSPTCYTGRELGTGYSFFMSLAMSLRLHGKLWIDENDIRTHVPAPGNQGFGKTNTLRDTISMQRRELANALCNGAAYWWMDQGGGWYDDPYLLEELKRLADIMARGAHCDRSSAAEVAVVIDERSVVWRGSGRGQQSFEGVVDIGHLGAPVDFILLQDLPLAKPYKLYLFKYGCRVNADILTMVNQIVKKDGRWAVWVERPGWVHEDERSLGWANSALLTGLQLREDGSAANADASLSAQTGCPAVQFDGWVSAYLAKPPSAAQLRALCNAAGVHLYLDTDDVVYADASFIAVHTHQAGPKRLRLQHAGTLLDLVTLNEYAGASEIVLGMQALETAIMYKGSKAQWEQLR